MAAETYVIGGLGTLVSILGGIVAAVLSKRLDTIERKQEASDGATHLLAIAVAQLTIEVRHLNEQLAAKNGGE